MNVVSFPNTGGQRVSPRALEPGFRFVPESHGVVAVGISGRSYVDQE